MKKRRRPLDETSWTTSQPAHIQSQQHLKTLAERALPQQTIADRVGLTRAYEAPNSIYIYISTWKCCLRSWDAGKSVEIGRSFSRCLRRPEDPIRWHYEYVAIRPVAEGPRSAQRGHKAGRSFFRRRGFFGNGKKTVRLADDNLRCSCDGSVPENAATACAKSLRKSR